MTSFYVGGEIGVDVRSCADGVLAACNAERADTRSVEETGPPAGDCVPPACRERVEERRGTCLPVPHAHYFNLKSTFCSSCD